MERKNELLVKIARKVFLSLLKEKAATGALRLRKQFGQIVSYNQENATRLYESLQNSPDTFNELLPTLQNLQEGMTTIVQTLQQVIQALQPFTTGSEFTTDQLESIYQQLRGILEQLATSLNQVDEGLQTINQWSQRVQQEEWFGTLAALRAPEGIDQFLSSIFVRGEAAPAGGAPTEIPPTGG